MTLPFSITLSFFVHFGAFIIMYLVPKVGFSLRDQEQKYEIYSMYYFMYFNSAFVPIIFFHFHRDGRFLVTDY